MHCLHPYVSLPLWQSSVHCKFSNAFSSFRAYQYARYLNITVILHEQFLCNPPTLLWYSNCSVLCYLQPITHVQSQTLQICTKKFRTILFWIVTYLRVHPGALGPPSLWIVLKLAANPPSDMLPAPSPHKSARRSSLRAADCAPSPQAAHSPGNGGAPSVRHYH